MCLCGVKTRDFSLCNKCLKLKLQIINDKIKIYEDRGKQFKHRFKCLSCGEEHASKEQHETVCLYCHRENVIRNK